MNDLVKYLVEGILQEDNISKIVVIYSGRFQPAAKHHYATFKWLQGKFGKDDTYVATSDKVELPKSPLNFEEKQNIWARHGVDSSKVVKVKSPYKAEEILAKYDPNTTAVIFVFGEKDAERLKTSETSYFRPYDPKNVLDNYTKHGYFIIAPHVSLKVRGKELSGTSVRDLLGSKRINTEAKKALFKEIFGWYDDVIFNKIVPKFEDANKNINEKINELSAKKKVVNEDTISEGGNAFPKIELSALKKENLDSTIKVALANYGMDDLNFSPIGNVSKPVLNDIDIAIDTEELSKHLNLDQKDKDSFFISLDKAFKSIGKPFAISKGINIFHILALAVTPQGTPQPFIDKDGNPVNNSKDPYVQIDVMMGHRKWREKHFSGAKDSKFKAIVRNMLLSDIASQIVIEKNGTKNKFLLNPSDGFFLVTFEELPNGKKKEISRKLISKDMNDVAKTLFGDKYTFEDINTYEKLFALLNSDDFKYPKFRPAIIAKFKEYLASVKDHDVPTLNEGGIAGHMSHPYEDLGLSFHDMKEIVRRSLGGNLHIEKAVTEKLDGQNFSITWQNNQIKGARNKTQMKDFGNNALDLNQLIKFFDGRGNLQKAFTESLTTLRDAILSLSEKQRFKIFANGHRFMSFEILYPETQNVIPYNQRKLVFHNTFEVDQEGNKIGPGEKDSARMLSGMIRQRNQHKGSGFDIQGPQVVDIVKDNMSHVKEKKIIGEIEKLQAKYGLGDDATNKDFLQKEWEMFILKTAHKMKYQIPKNVVQLIAHRFSSQDKNVKLVQIAKMIDNPKFLTWLKSFDDKDQLDMSKNMRWPIEKIFLELGTDVLENANNLVLASDDEAAKKIQIELQTTLDFIKKNKDSIDATKLKKLKYEFERLNSIGGLKNIIPSEGIVFSYNNHLYKLVGKFPAINQILGIFKYT